MKKRKLLIALPLALGLVVASAMWVKAADNEMVTPQCADITNGSAAYRQPKQVTDVSGSNTWTNDGWLSFTMTLDAPTCFDVTYGLVVLSANPGASTPTVLASSAVPGDGTSNKVAFNLDVTSRAPQNSICVYAYTSGSDGSSSSDKTGAAFDGTSSGAMLDRAPDGPFSGGPLYCVNQNGDGSGGSGYN